MRHHVPHWSTYDGDDNDDVDEEDVGDDYLARTYKLTGVKR